MSPERPQRATSLEQLVRLPTVEDLIFILESKEIDLTYNHFLTILVPMDRVNVLTQPRKTFEDIETLGESIGESGQINPMTSALLNEKQSLYYLETLNDIWRTNYQIGNLAPIMVDGGPYFSFLLAGERRFRGHHYLKEVGCEECHEKYGPGPCFERHFPPFLFPNYSVEVRLRPQISPEDAIDLQFSENTHMRVPPHEEAQAYYNYWHHKRRIDPEYPLSKFARKVGRTTETIRRALRFCLLPLDIQEKVAQKEISYGIACEIARLQDVLQLDDNQLRVWANDTLTTRYKLEDFRQRVNDYLAVAHSGQQDMLTDIFSPAQQSLMERLRYRQPVAREMIYANWQFIQYLTRVFHAFEVGSLKKKDLPLSPRSPVKTFRALATWQKDCLLPHLRGFVREETSIQQFLTLVREKLPEEESFLADPDSNLSEMSLVTTYQKLTEVQNELLPYLQDFLGPEEHRQTAAVLAEISQHLTYLRSRLGTENDLAQSHTAVIFEAKN